MLQPPDGTLGTVTGQQAHQQPDTIDGLPIRVRQANLAAPLAGESGPVVRTLMDWSTRDAGTTSGYRRTPWQEQVAHPGHAPEPRTTAPAPPAPGNDRVRRPERAEVVRDMMSALQTGARRARGSSGQTRVPGTGYPHNDQNQN
ncbi:hypothetical protein AB0N87_43670 [Streptomyces sp. NPDC093228]|uniref:hypothetical protein n=1 Tax=Streptomyces sp. NPDC093228 TaxID=3155070 RepID=UPI00342F373B